jgi:hypothetical protein
MRLYQLSYSRFTVGIAVDTDMIVIIDHDQIAQLQMSSKGCCFTSNTFLSTPIAKVTISVIIYVNVIAGIYR